MKLNKSISTSFLKIKFFNKALRSFNQINLRNLFQEQSLQSSCLIAAGLALLYTLYLFPLSFLRGHGGFFERGEPLLSLSGWWSFMADGWRIPLLKTKLMNAPQGANIAFTNSIPLLAILLKPFQYWLPKGFHYFGCWFVISYTLQAVSSVLLLRVLGQRTTLATIAGAGMALMMPAFLYQFEYIALTTHGILLLGLTLYFAGTKNPRYFKDVNFYYSILLPVALLIHPYLFAMAFMLYAAFLGEHYLKFPRESKKCLIAFAQAAGIVILIAFICGYLSHTLRSTGYSYYSMNVLAPVRGGKLGYRFINATGGQIRGFNYLGMGVIASLVFTAATRWRWLLQIVQRYRILTGVALLLTLFAISNRIFYGGQEIFRYSVFYPFTLITETFRSSGRMFWPVGYILMLIGLLGILRFENKQVSAFLILGILSLQFYDTQSFRQLIFKNARQPSTIQASWHRLMRSVSAVHLYPAPGCGGVKNVTNHTRTVAFFQGLAARHGRPINTAVVSRGKSNCNVKHAAFRKPLARGQLYVISKESYNTPHHISTAINQGWCRKTPQGTLCVANTGANWWKTRTPSTNTSLKSTNSWFQRLTQSNSALPRGARR
jgi:hypothetical protein